MIAIKINVIKKTYVNIVDVYSKYISMNLKLNMIIKNYHYGGNLSHRIYCTGDLWSTYHCYQLYFNMFGYILPFWYFPGWLGGWPDGVNQD